MKRGIITNTGKTHRIDSNSVEILGALSPADLNYYLLYWDKIVMPTNNIIHQAIPYEEELMKYGILDRPRVPFQSWSSKLDNGYYDLFVVSQSIIANKLLSEKSDIDWTIHQIGEEVIIGKEQQKDFQSLKVELLDCLPVPIENLNPEIILEFKEKRKDELNLLHKCIDELYLEILKSPDKDLQRKIAISEFEKAIQNVEKTSKERFIRTSKYNFITELNLSGKDLVSSATYGFLVDYFTHGVNIPIATILSGLASVVKIKINKTTSVEASKDKQKLSFLADASKEGLIKK